jgi:hypothetical protein
MKRMPRKLVLSRETLRDLEDHTLRYVGGGSAPAGGCDTYQDCSIACFVPSDIGSPCG